MADKNIKSINLLPEFLRTEKNSKFLSSTIDQLIQPPALERIEGYVGSTFTPTYDSTGDVYVSESLPLRRNYQLEPALVVKDSLGDVQDVIGIDDLTNEISLESGSVDNFDRLYRSNFYSYDPHIDWDKFVNYQEYFWLPNGPTSVTLYGQQVTSTSTFTVRDNEDGTAYIFNSENPEDDPIIRLYRGNTYVFDVQSSYNFYIKTQPTAGTSDQLSGVINNGTSSGLITLVVGSLAETPTNLFYTSDDNYYTQGEFIVQNPEENSQINVELEILGKKYFTSGNGVNLVNGMKVNFGGRVTPAYYRDKFFFVEGVGSAIRLVDAANLDVPQNKIDTDKFDASEFDTQFYDDASTTPLPPEYVTINRASKDLNPWSRYNRWFHKDVITASASANLVQPVYPNTYRARRPIIEFKPDLKLYNFGSVGIPDVDFIDTITTDAFSFVEGSAGHHVDGYLLEQGNRVIFAADTDSKVRNKVYEVKYIYTDNKLRLTLKEIETINADSVVSVIKGQQYNGTSWRFDGTNWIFAQQKTSKNQAPLFDLFDSNGNSYGDINYYLSDFKGNKIFSYEIGTGSNDPILGFPLKYKNSYGTGSFLFANNFMTETITITKNSDVTESVATSNTFLKFVRPTGDEFANVWVIAEPYEIPILTVGSNSFYEPPLSLTNNPLNGAISEFTLSDISDHIKSAIERSSDFVGNYPGESNLRQLSDIAKYGTRLISHINPMAFAQMFIGKVEHNVIDAVTKSADQYNQFKLAFLKKIAALDDQATPISIVDQALKEINADKDLLSPWYLSDMVAYGTDKKVSSYTVVASGNTIYPLSSDFDLSNLSLRSVLIYINNEQMISGRDYQFVSGDSAVEILISLVVGDVIEIHEYTSTKGCYVPATPTKLGLYPKFAPRIYLDSTFVNPTTVIQCHDGSLTVAYNDYRDAVILELEKRIYNNIKTNYNPNILDINTAFIGAFRKNSYTTDEFNKIIQHDFIKWAGLYGVDAYTNSSFDETNSYTWNYTGAYNSYLNTNTVGGWRSVYTYFYDTDRPDSRPWEMLGFTYQPEWWTSEYGPTPFTSGNDKLWDDIEQGYIRQGDRQGVNSVYARPGLSNLLPVNEYGKLVTPDALLSNVTISAIRQNWKFGEWGPAETAWRHSSYWPFVIQKLLALTQPANYAALMYDPHRLTKNLANQWTYGDNKEFISLKNVLIHGDGTNLTSGYSVLVSEIGKQRTGNYVSTLKNDLAYSDFNLFYKVGGFVNKNKLQITIDAIDPTSSSPGALLPPEDYNLILNVSNPVKSTSLSGIIVQKSNGKFLVKGYDTVNPYFSTLSIIRNSNSPAITVGGVSEPYVIWGGSGSATETTLSSIDTTSATGSSVGLYYQQGQIVKYGDKFYRVTTNHRSGNTFDTNYFQSMPYLPIKGGATVQTANRFTDEVNQVPYGTEYSTVQEVYDLILGYGAWAESQGFIFDEFSTDLQTVVDWAYTGKEFLYWTTQNWADNSVITLSPFADQIKFKFSQSVVDNVFNDFYDYSLLQANGNPFPKSSISVNRENGVCTISTNNSTDGIYFTTIHSVQKEHAIVFNNTTMFNDTIYDIETGYRQRRMKLAGFRTKNWDGDYFSPGFVYDRAEIKSWESYASYNYGDVVRFSGNYYSAKENVLGSEKFNFNQWIVLDKKPEASLLPNFDYKISQFEDFYSLDIDNFDAGQQQLAQHLIGYTPRVYLNNIFTNPVAQYKFYQGFIKEKGTRNSISKLAKASIQNLQGELTYSEEWAFRIGHYGSYETFKEIEVPLTEGKFIDNPQVINFVEEIPSSPNDLIYYATPTDLSIKPAGYLSTQTFVTTSSIEIIKLPYAGYVRFDDIDSTAYNENTILDIANVGNLKEGDLIWLGYKKNGDWDVLRYTRSDVKILQAYSDIDFPGQLIFVTSGMHGLSKGEIVTVSQFNDAINSVFKIVDVPALNKFAVEFASLSSAGIISSNEGGLLFKFLSVRYPSFDQMPSDAWLASLPYDTKVWIDDSGNGTWVVYEKINNYTATNIKASADPKYQKLGWSISKLNNSKLFAVGAPGYTDSLNIGSVYAYLEKQGSVQGQFRYGINRSTDQYVSSTSETEFGYSVVYDSTDFNDTGYGLIFAGAPAATSIGPNSAPSQGIVKISSIDPVLVEEVEQLVLINDIDPKNSERFGHALYVGGSGDSRTLLVGAPGTINANTGSVYYYTFNTTSTVNLQLQGTLSTSSITQVGSRWGSSISGNRDGTIVAVGAPGYFTSTGLVAIFTGNNLSWSQTIQSPFAKQNKFGESVKVSSSGEYLFISAPEARGSDQSFGKVAVYKKEDEGYILQQVLTNPFPMAGMKFGQAIDINSDGTELAVTAVGFNRNISDTFDKYSSLKSSGDAYVNDPYSDLSDADTTFDSDSTRFHDSVLYSGTAYVFNRKNNLFRLAQELKPINTEAGTNFGYSVAVNDNSVYVGAPAYRNSINPDATTSTFCQFYKKDITIDSWKTLRTQDNLVEVDTLQKVTLIDTLNEEVVEYLDVVDPLKGRIPGIAEQDLRYKSLVDPAVYSLGTDNNVVDETTAWLDEHVGDLWWDLNTVKFTWYEQGEPTYRKNNWGKVFPGSTIDIYEWVGSELLPSEWAAIADTVEGLSSGISGQPKYPDNSVLSVKQVYNYISNSFSNYYYFWVKNKVSVPNAKNRRISAYQVAASIEDPTLYGLKYAAIISEDSVALANCGTDLVSNNISLNVSSDVISNTIPKHTEWLLLQENSPTSVPNTLLEKKLLDSLLGHDSLGNPVPDPELSARSRYGIGIRPRQTMFKDRYEALRNLIEFTNQVLAENLIVGNYDLTRFNSQELPPDEYSREYDQIVEDNEGLLLVDVNNLIRAELSCVIDNGRIRAVNIINSGFGYKIPPKVTIVTDQITSANILTEIDELGRVISATVDNPGEGLTSTPALIVRPYTVIVLADSAYNGKWTKYIYDTSSKAWVRAHTQSYNTPLYWDKIDWVSEDYNPYQDYEYTIDEVYEINELTVDQGAYVKVKNGGLGTYIILEKTDGTGGTFDQDWNIVYSEQGTIKINGNIWNVKTGDIGFDYNGSYDQTLYSQAPDLELENILLGLKKDVFVNELKVYWNLFFFKAVKYALSEQKLLDWALKTSFISAVNYAGSLDQRPVYKLQNTDYFEDYLREVKPYHTNIRSFTTNYENIEPSQTYTTDFDLPAIYDKTTGKFTSAGVYDLLDQYPWKAWADNHEYQIEEISVSYPGLGYTSAPTVEIIAQGTDVGNVTTATARAFIRSGSVYDIKVEYPGYGYTVPPLVLITGGTALDSAVGYARLGNSLVRTTNIGMKFDRTSRSTEAPDIDVSNVFVCDGYKTEFVLDWLASTEKTDFTLLLDGVLVFDADYTVEYYSEEYNGYSKKYSKIKFLNYIPGEGQTLQVEYKKNIALLNAADRIANYYAPASGMPGADLDQLMSGITYPKTQIQGLPFDYTTSWDPEYKINGDQKWAGKFDENLWADDINFYTSTTSTSAFVNSSATSSVVLSTTTGIVRGLLVNVISTITTVFSTSTVRVSSVTTATRTVTFDNTVTVSLPAGTEIEFWRYDSNSSALDSAIDGGDLGYTMALGINPEDITISGDGFITPNTSYAPEELVPGEVHESLGINVYTKDTHGGPVVLASYFEVTAGTTATHAMSITPPNTASIIVSFDNRLFYYNTNSNFTSVSQFTINWATNEIIIPPQPTSGKLGYTIVSMGGGSDVSAGLIDSASASTNIGDTSTTVASLANVESVNSVYVTLNGIALSESEYEFGPSVIHGNRAAVTVYNLNPLIENTLSAWFFTASAQWFNLIHEEISTVSSATSISITYLPGTIEPLAASTIVELDDGTGPRILRPPYIDYYNVTNAVQYVYGINNIGGPFSPSQIRVYVNGQFAGNNGFNYNITGGGTTITFNAGYLNLNDVIAIVSLPTVPDYEYDIVGSNIIFPTPVTGELRVITYTNHDDMFMRTESFDGNPSRRYRISRPVLNDNYIWVILNGVPLVNKYDFEILDDRVTIQLSDEFENTESDRIVITSISSAHLALDVVGYRIFNDIFNRSHFKRLSKQNTTYLTAPLLFTDKEIYVADSTVLSPPIASKNIPGVVIIDGERIEFFKVTGNVLSQLRRSTLGTAPSYYSEENTKVIDQGPNQTIPFGETISRQDLITDKDVLTYTISSVPHIANTGTYNQFINDGISLTTSTAATDQVMVFYGGRPLNKVGTFHHSIEMAYDSPEMIFTTTNVVGLLTTATTLDLPATTDVGTAYIVTATNQVWVYTGSVEPTAVNGYVYKGLDYHPPEFTINTATQQITLNMIDGVQDGIKLTIIKREFTTATLWNNGESIIESSTVQAQFLQARPAELPDKYYYGGDPTLDEDSGFALTDEDGEPLEGL